MILYILLFLLLFLCVIDFKINKKIFSPTFLFNFIWFITLFLYEFKLSHIQHDLTERTILCFYICVVSYNLIMYIIKFLKLKEIKFNFKSKFSVDEKIKFCNLVVLIVLIIEIIYSKGFPLYWKLFGLGKTYFDFGIPSLHGAFCGLVICLGTYSLLKKKKSSILYFLIGIILISRQILISIVVQWVIAYFMNKNILNSIKKLIVVGIICILFFNIIGNFRSGNTVMQDVFQAKEKYKNIPNSVKWIYSYMTFSVSNFNNLVKKTDGGVNKGSSTLEELLPTVILNKINMKNNFNKKYLISLNYNVSTYLPPLYLDFGLIGIGIFNILIAILGYILFNNINYNKSNKNLLLYSVFGHNIIFLFFNNMFLYLPVIIQFIYIMLIFNENGEKQYE